MDYRLGNSKKIYSRGETNPITCPKCNKKVNLSVFTNFEARAIAKLPLIKTGNVYLLVCPECASLFTVDKSNGDTFKKGEALAIMQGDLKELEPFDV